MFCKASLLTAVSLAVFSVANPAPFAPPKREPGTVIPLPKRSSLTTADGVFDWDKAILQTVATKNKHRQNLINLEKNKGTEAFNEVRKSLWATTPSV